MTNVLMLLLLLILGLSLVVAVRSAIEERITPEHLPPLDDEPPPAGNVDGVEVYQLAVPVAHFRAAEAGTAVAPYPDGSDTYTVRTCHRQLRASARLAAQLVRDPLFSDVSVDYRGGRPTVTCQLEGHPADDRTATITF